MSTVLWANVCVGDQLVSDQQDCHALYKHAQKLDAIARDLGLASFAAACDDTDARYQFDDDLELPTGMTSTCEVMVRSGTWLGVQEADRMLDGLLARIRERKIRFGLIQNQHDAVLEELGQVLAFLRSRPDAERFNLSVVM
jgi:hypothetical protein